MSCCELSWRHALTTAVRPDLVVVLAPFRQGDTRLVQVLEPVLVEAFVAKLAVEAFDVAVLHGPARLDQQVPDVVGLRPANEDPTGELRPVVGTHGHGIATKDGGLVQQPCYVVATD